MANVIVNDTNLTNIASAIREKNGETTTYKPSEMAAAILAITTGEGGGTGDCNGLHIPDEALTLEGNMGYGLPYNRWNWFIEACGDKIVTKDIIAANFMFSGSTELEEIPFDLNFSSSSTNHDLQNVFADCFTLTSIPKFVGCIPKQTQNIFDGCCSIKNLPDDIEDWFDWSWMEKQTSGYNGNRSSMFNGCYSLRSIPMGFLNHGNPVSNYSYTYFQYGFTDCTALDELVGLPIPYTATYTSNMFRNTFNNCCRLKELTFATQEDGTPYTVNWSNQTIDLGNRVGYFYETYVTDNFLKYSGITADKLVSDDASYAALKDDPDWFTVGALFSRYNHDSAVNTINSLPDASSGSGNVIRFTPLAGDGEYGSLGKAINTLTEEEIAVATAKGWTVSLG